MCAEVWRARKDGWPRGKEGEHHRWWASRRHERRCTTRQTTKRGRRRKSVSPCVHPSVGGTTRLSRTEGKERSSVSATSSSYALVLSVDSNFSLCLSLSLSLPSVRALNYIYTVYTRKVIHDLYISLFLYVAYYYYVHAHRSIYLLPFPASPSSLFLRPSVLTPLTCPVGSFRRDTAQWRSRRHESDVLSVGGHESCGGRGPREPAAAVVVVVV